jgi:DNA (cytosine-5)-methyltransferase 1
MRRVIDEFRPRWIIGENVTGIITLALDQVLSDLEDQDYTCQAFIIPACAVGAPHRRDRVWIVANANSQRLPRRSDTRSSDQEGEIAQQQLVRLLSADFWNDISKPDPHRVDDGLSRETHRNHALGNAIVPQVSAEIMSAMILADQASAQVS